MENKDKKPSNLIIYILLFALILCLIAVLGSIRQQDNKELYKKRDLTPTAGITYYMSALEKACMDGAEPDLEAVEAAITPVAAPMESDIPETEEEVIEDGTTEEDLLNAYFGYTPDDAELELWMQIVMDECGHTEPDEGVAAVADVVANRVRSERFPNTIRGVIYQTGQFQPVGDGTFGRFYITDRVREICSECICEGIRYPYLFFTAGGYNSYCKPGEVIGNHYFGY